MRKILVATTFLMLSMGSALSAEIVVDIENFAFDDANLTIAVGDTVRFVNKDGATHTATAVDQSFDTGRLSRGDGSEITFSQAGTFAYFCSIHPRMKAIITVQ